MKPRNQRSTLPVWKSNKEEWNHVPRGRLRRRNIDEEQWQRGNDRYTATSSSTILLLSRLDDLVFPNETVVWSRSRTYRESCRYGVPLDEKDATKNGKGLSVMEVEGRDRLPEKEVDSRGWRETNEPRRRMIETVPRKRETRERERMGSFKEDLIWWKEERRAWFYQHVNKANAHRTVCQLTPKRTNWPSLTTIRPWDVIKKTFKWLERERNIRDSTHDDSLSSWFYCYCYVIFFLLLNARNGWMIEWYNRRKYLRSLRDLVIFTLYIFVDAW